LGGTAKAVPFPDQIAQSRSSNQIGQFKSPNPDHPIQIGQFKSLLLI
jgi:hypothetical protein